MLQADGARASGSRALGHRSKRTITNRAEASVNRFDSHAAQLAGRPQAVLGRRSLTPAGPIALQASLGNQAVQRLVRAGVPWPTVPVALLHASVHRSVVLFDEKGRPYPGKKRANATADQVLEWTFTNIGKKAHERLSADKALLAAFCDDTSETIELTAASGTAQKSYSAFLEKLTKFGKTAETRVETGETTPKKEPTSTVALQPVDGASSSETALQLEAFLNPCLQAAKITSKQEVKNNRIKPNALPICGLLNLLAATLENFQVQQYPDLLQVIRLQNTFEYDLLTGVSGEITICLKKLDKAVSLAHETMQDENIGDPESKASLIYDEVGDAIQMSRPDFLKLLFQEGVKRGVHGKTGTSALATWPQKEAALGELVLCAPMIREINHLAVMHADLYLWDTHAFIVKIVQGTVRRFKVASLLDFVVRLDAVVPQVLRFRARDRINAKAFDSMSSKLTKYIAEATAYSAKGQIRILETLCDLLNIDDQLRCIGYEDTSNGEVPADIVLTGHGEHADDKLIIEIESIPETHRKAGTAYEYLCQRYEHKMSTIGEKLGQLGGAYKLVLMAPTSTRLLENDIERIQADDRFL